MNTPTFRPAPLHVPVLTEVVELDEPVLAPSTEPPQAPPEMATATLGTPEPIAVAGMPMAPPPTASASPAYRPPAPVALSFDEAQMTQRVLTEVQRQIDGMLEYRLREALAPILARTSEALVRELRQELSKTMRDVVSRAVAQEVVRQRTR